MDINKQTKQTNKQTTQDNRYQSIPPQATIDIAIGLGLLKQKREGKKKLQSAQNSKKDSVNSANCEQEDH